MSQNDAPPRAAFRTLTYFIRHHINYLPAGVPYPDHQCPICLEHASESREHIIQIDLPSCHHIFGESCFERHISDRYTCPLCRSPWFNEENLHLGSTARGIILTVVVDDDVSDEGPAHMLRNMRELLGFDQETDIEGLADIDTAGTGSEDDVDLFGTDVETEQRDDGRSHHQYRPSGTGTETLTQVEDLDYDADYTTDEVYEEDMD